MAKQWQPPRGIRLEYRDGRPKPFLVRVYKAGRYRATAFETEREQLAFARQAARDKQAPPIDLEKWMRFCAFEREIGGMKNLDAVVRAWCKQRHHDSLPLADALDQFYRDKGLEGIDYGTLRRYQHALGQFGKAFPRHDLGNIREDQILAWLLSIRHQGKPLKPITRNNWRKYLKTFFLWAVRRGYLVESPVRNVPKARVTPEPVGILTVEQGERLFRVNREQPCIGRLALEAFAGLRYSSARDLKREEIVFEEKGIHLTASNIKTRRRFYVDGFPDNLWDWLRHAPESCWQIKPRQYLEAKKHAFIRADIPHPHNCLRHSFCTYHIAAFKDVGKTATLLCHNSLAMLNRHYRGNATQAEGTAWFQILP